MANVASYMVKPVVHDEATGPLRQIEQQAGRTGAAVEQMDARVGRSGQTFGQLAARIEPVEAATLRVQRATERVTRDMEAAERAARAEGIAQERLGVVLAAGAARREQAALAAVRGFNAEQQAAALAAAGYANLAAQVTAAARAQAQVQTNTAARELDRFAAANDNARASSGRFGQALGQAGFQVGDFASQVSAGGNAMVAFGQQASQFLGVFGTAGAIAGAAVVMGVLAAQLFGAGDAQRQLNDALRVGEEGFSRATAAAEAWGRGLEDEAQRIIALTSHYASLDAARRQYEVRSLEAARAEMQRAAQALGESPVERLAGLERGLGNTLAANEARRGAGQRVEAPPPELLAAAAALRQFREELASGDPSQAIVNVANALSEASRAAGPFQRDFARVVEELDKAVPQADRLTRHLALNTAQLAAARGEAPPTGEAIGRVGAAMDGASGRAGALAGGLARAAASLAALRARAIDDPLAAVNAEIARNEQIFAAMQRGGLEAGRAVQAEQERQAEITRRATALQDDFAKALRESGVAAEEAAQRAGEAAPVFVAQAGRAVDSGRAVANQMRALEEAARGAARGVRETTRAVREVPATMFEDGAAGQTVFPAAAVDAALQRARDAAEREVARAEQDAIRARERLERDQVQLVARYSADLARGTFDAIVSGGASATATLGNLLRNTLRNAAVQALDVRVARPVVGGIANALGLGRNGGAGANDNGGGFSFGSALSLGRQTFGGGLNTGVGIVDRIGNAGLYTGINNGVTVAGAVGGAAGIIGGGIGIANGLNRGGVGGVVQTAGGAASAIGGALMLAGLAGGPLGLAIGAGLSLLGGVLPGQRPSAAGGSANINFATGATTTARLASGAANLQRSLDDAGGIASLQNDVAARLGFSAAGGVAVGTTRRDLYLDIGRGSARFGNSEEGRREFEAAVRPMLFEAFRETAGLRSAGRNERIVLGSSSFEDLLANIDFADFAESFRAGREANDEYAAAVRALGDEIGSMISRAQRIGLATDQFDEEYRQRIGFLQAQRDAGILGIRASIAGRLGGDADLARRAAEAGRSLAELSEAREVRGQLERMGASAETVTRAMADLAEAQRRERDARIDAALGLENMASAARSAVEWLDAQRLGANSSLSPFARMEEAQRQFDAAARGPDVAALTRAADALLGSSRDVLGGATAAFAEREAFVLRAVANAGLRAAPADSGAAAALNARIAGLEAQIARLAEALDAAAVEQRRANTAAMFARAA